MAKKIISIFLLLFFAMVGSVEAFKAETFVTFANPVRGPENWQGGLQDPLDLPKFQYQESTRSAFPVTWLLRYDAVVDATMSAFFNDLIETDKNQSLGAFLEITPTLAETAKVIYNPGFSPFNANRIFLSGYTTTEREDLIDTYMSAFFDRFGFYPKSVSAWHLDSYSLQYLQSKYSVVTAMNCDDQYSTDHYRLWGGYLGSPYFPDKNNSLVPARNFSERVNLAMVRWAQRDLYGFYGDGGASLRSVQVNDYIKNGLGTIFFNGLIEQYSQKDFNEFSYINIGLENDDNLAKYKSEITRTYKSLADRRGKYDLKPISLSDFGEWFKARYPESTPAYFYETGDITGKESGRAYWYMSPFFRIGIYAQDGKTEITDFRLYNRNVYEDNLVTRNESYSLFHEIPAIIDSVKYPGTAITIPKIDLNGWKVVHSKIMNGWELTFKNGDQIFRIEPERIVFINFQAPEISSKEIKVINKGNETIWEIVPYTPFKNTTRLTLFAILALIVAFFYFRKKSKPGSKSTRNLIIGTTIALIAGFTLYRNGLLYPFGMGFWGPNGHDAIFHLSLIEKFSQSPLNFSHPQIAGEKIANYHFLFDFVSGLIVRLTGISSVDFYFRVFPVVAGIALVYLLDKLLKSWKYNRSERLLSVFLAFLAGSLGFIPKIITGQDILAGESAFWANQSVSIFLNPPYTLSLIGILLFLTTLSSRAKRGDLFKLIILILLGGLLAQTKVYAFILLLGALLFSKKIKLFIGVLIVGILISLPFTEFGGSSPFILSPLWFTKSLFASFDRFYWLELVTAWQAYEASGNILKLLIVNAFALVVFLVGNLGVRVLGLFQLLKTSPEFSSEKLVRWIIILGLLVPLLFVQNINPWNTIQFMYYSLFFLAPFTAKFLIKLPIVLAAILLFIGILTSLGTLRDYIGFFSSSRISYSELFALDKLKDSPRGIVLAPVFDNLSSRSVAPPKPLYSYVSNAYISAFSGQPEFISDTINLDITGYDYKARSRDVQKFFNTEDISWATEFLIKNKIAYIYLTPLQEHKLDFAKLALEKIFDSGEISIYKYKYAWEK